MIVDVAEPLRCRKAITKLKALMVVGRSSAIALEYFRHRTRPNLIRMIQHVGLPEADVVLARLQACTRKQPCRMYVCPVCGTKLKARTRDNALDRIVERLGRFPGDFEISYVTIDGPRTELEVEAARGALAGFERQVDNFIRRNMGTTSWYGIMDISTDGLIHLHALLIHPGVPRDEMKSRLKGSFTGANQVEISKWHRSKTLAENLQGVFNYSVRADRLVRVSSMRDGPDSKQSPTSAVNAVKRLVAIQTLAGRGVRGLRFIRNMKAVHKGLKVAELETLKRRTKRVRFSSKSMPTLPWAPRGEQGFHLSLSKNENLSEDDKM